jgi:hypothetical protein
VKLVRLGFAAVALTLLSSQAHAQAATPPRMYHAAAGKEQCLTCHAANANANIKSQPASHSFPVTACAMCHQPYGKPTPAIPHAVTDAFTQCRTCHVANSPMGAKALPAFHANWNVAICRMCHTAPQAGR